MRLNADTINAFAPAAGWTIDTYSTILSRRHSYHAMRGHLRLVRIKHVPTVKSNSPVDKPLLSGVALALVGYAVITLTFCF